MFAFAPKGSFLLYNGSPLKIKTWNWYGWCELKDI